jgi:hypothetical protein
MVRQVLDPRRCADAKCPVFAKLDAVARRNAAQVDDGRRSVDPLVDRSEKVSPTTHRQGARFRQSRHRILD